MNINEIATMVHELAVEKGWWDTSADIDDKLMNLHAEISEAWEEHRNGHDIQEVYLREDGKPEGIPIELADLIIRTLDMCAAYGIDIEKAILLKHEYNKTRPYRHGGKRA